MSLWEKDGLGLDDQRERSCSPNDNAAGDDLPLRRDEKLAQVVNVVGRC